MSRPPAAADQSLRERLLDEWGEVFAEQGLDGRESVEPSVTLRRLATVEFGLDSELAQLVPTLARGEHATLDALPTLQALPATATSPPRVDAEASTLVAREDARPREDAAPLRDVDALSRRTPAHPSQPSPASTRANEPAPGTTTLSPLDLSRELVVHEPIGTGGMGVVHVAEQRSLARRIAVKRLRPDRRSPALVQAFAGEAQVTANLEHPNIVPVYALGQDAGGDLVLAMRHVVGEPWSTVLQRDPPASGWAALRRQLVILKRVTDAMAYAHAQGFVHRDLKPNNVMVGRYGQVYVLDWGLAVDISTGPAAGRRGAPTPAQAGGRAGTPAYMAPEMVTGRPVDERTDVYLLGAILHEVILGAPPHRGDSLVEVMIAAHHNAVLPLSAPPTIPAALVDIVAACLATDPAERIPTVAALGEAIDRVLSGESRRTESREAAARVETLLLAAQAEEDAADLHPAQLAERYGRLLDAEAQLQAALQAWPENPHAQRLRGPLRREHVRCALQAGDLALADSFLRRAHELDLPEVEALQAEIERRRRESDPASLVALDRGIRILRVFGGCAVLACVWLCVVQGLVFVALSPDGRNGPPPKIVRSLVLGYAVPLLLLQLAQWWILPRLEPGRRQVYVATLVLTGGSIAYSVLYGLGAYVVLHEHHVDYLLLFLVLPLVPWLGGLTRLLSPKVRGLFPAG